MMTIDTVAAQAWDDVSDDPYPSSDSNAVHTTVLTTQER